LTCNNFFYRQSSAKIINQNYNSKFKIFFTFYIFILIFKLTFYLPANESKIMAEKQTTVILGIDPGIADTGYGVVRSVKNSGLACIDYGSIKTGAQEKMPDRLGKINRELDKIIKRYKPDLVAVEQLFFCNNVKTALIVGQARGVILLTAMQNNILTTEFTPLQVKQAVSSYGAASKMQVQKMVKILLNLDRLPKPDDAADALAIAICAANTKKY